MLLHFQEEIKPDIFILNLVKSWFSILNIHIFFTDTNPSSPFKKPLMGNLNQSILGGLSSNASDSGSSMATTSSGSSGCSSGSGSGSGNNKRPPSLTESPFQSGHLPTIADVRSPDVLHVLQENCDCLSHPMQVNFLKIGKFFIASFTLAVIGLGNNYSN